MSKQRSKPICVDLDGTLIRNDVTFWSVKEFIKKNFLNIFKVVFWFLFNRAYMKKMIAQEIELDTGILGYNKKFLDFLIEQRTSGVPLFLATASDEIYAKQIADDLGIFDGVFASNGEVSLASEVKAQTLCAIFGEGGFIYAGNSKDDLAVWSKSGGYILVNPSEKVLECMSGREYLLFN